MLGQIGRDLVLRIERMPDAGAGTSVTTRKEMLGGKGANQALALAQLSLSVALLGSVGVDAVGEGEVLRRAERDGIYGTAVAERGTTALLVDVVEASGVRRLFEHVPPESLVRPDDVDAQADTIRPADLVCLQLQQPADALLAAARLATAMVACDGAIPADGADELTARADVLRADHDETEQMTGTHIESVPDAGDAFFAGLVAALVNGLPPERASELAADAATSTVQRLGGRPALAHLRQQATTSSGGWAPTR